MSHRWVLLVQDQLLWTLLSAPTLCRLERVGERLEARPSLC